MVDGMGGSWHLFDQARFDTNVDQAADAWSVEPGELHRWAETVVEDARRAADASDVDAAADIGSRLELLRRRVTDRIGDPGIGDALTPITGFLAELDARRWATWEQHTATERAATRPGTVKQRVLDLLAAADTPLRPSDIAARLELNGPQTSRALTELRSAGVVETTDVDPTDRRSVHYVATVPRERSTVDPALRDAFLRVARLVESLHADLRTAAMVVRVGEQEVSFGDADQVVRIFETGPPTWHEPFVPTDSRSAL